MTNPTSIRPAAWIVGFAALPIGAALVQAGATPLTKEEQARVDRAIEGGVAYLKRSQGSQGSWAGPWEIHTSGYAALPALTLLECGVPAEEQIIHRAAEVVRREASRMDYTYEIALSILFLDRLGDAKDRELIQTLAVRLIVGQMETGGWSYRCPFPSKKTQEDVLAALRKLDPPQPSDHLTAVGQEAAKGPTAKRKPAKRTLEGTIGGPRAPLEGTTTGKQAAPPSEDEPETPKAAQAKAKPPAKKEDKAAEHPPDMASSLKKMPVFRDPDQTMKLLKKGRPFYVTDNSNTQFALLALWVAQRHEVPARRSMAWIVRRFESSQNADGSWSYRYRYGGGDKEGAAMTCAGLLGLAVGHGADRKPDVDRIRGGLAALSKNVGKPAGKWRNLPLTDLYFLWSLERVAVLYRLATIGENDWYRWGAEMLIANQQKRGFWTGGGYPKSSSTLDTCFALLFLKRANFVADLTAKLRYKAEELNQAVLHPSPSRSPGEARAPVKP